MKAVFEQSEQSAARVHVARADEKPELTNNLERFPVEVRGVSKSFGKQQVLDSIDLKCSEAQTVAVLGKSGAGKSVLLKLIIGLQEPDSGSICVNGKDITKLKIEDLNSVRKRVGFLFQQAALYDSLTVEENVAFPLRRHTRLDDRSLKKRVHELLHLVGMERDEAKLPSELSGGMQKRVGLARALALDPNIILFDEPTAGLDPITGAEIAGLILKFQKEKRVTSVIVTHDIQAVNAVADRAALLDRGKILFAGTVEELHQSQDPFVKRFLGGSDS